MASVGVGFFKDGWIVWNNRTLERLLGYEAGELVGQPTTVFYPSEAVYQWALSETMQQIEATGACSFDVEMITKSGAQRFINLNARAIDRNDFSKGRVWTFIDITERNSLRQQLAQSLAERDAYLDLAAVGVSLVREGRITWHNRTFARILGYDGEDLTGRPPAMVYANDAVAKAAAERALKEIAEHGSCLLDVEMVKKDGRPVSIELYGRELQPGMPESGRVWTFIDITERRRAEEEVRRALDRERELVATRARLVAMASHEFRTPLATLLSAAEILEHYGDRLGRDERREVINDISGAVKRMQAMLDNVINMGQREGRPLAFKPAPVDARTLTRKVFDEMHSLDQGEHQLELTMTRIPVPAARAFLDEELVRTILANLIGNACKYTPTDGRVKVSLQRMASGLAFEVRDDGIGIPETEQAQLFESFFRVSNVGAAAGTGIGLAVAKRAVDAHGGRISVASQVGKGSVFRVELPQPGTLQ
jgi:PAS domain S-box-containing protein